MLKTVLVSLMSEYPFPGVRHAMPTPMPQRTSGPLSYPRNTAPKKSPNCWSLNPVTCWTVLVTPRIWFSWSPDHAPLAEVRLDLDPAVESPRTLAPLIDPNIHSCGTVPPHGAAELAQPERDFYIVGMKSYGRAPTFLMLTGYEQVRSVVCALAGDLAGAAATELVLPETGVCSTDVDGGGGCGATDAVPSLSSSSVRTLAGVGR